MKVYVIYDPLYEEPVAVHKTLSGVNAKLTEWDGNISDSEGMPRYKSDTYWFNFDEFEVEE